MGVMDWLGSFKGVTLDPRRTQAARLTFDQPGKYDAWRKLSLVRLPSPAPWREAWKAGVESGFHERSMATFPDSAEQLFHELELPRQAL